MVTYSGMAALRECGSRPNIQCRFLQDVMRVLVESGADVRAEDDQGFSALLNAVKVRSSNRRIGINRAILHVFQQTSPGKRVSKLSNIPHNATHYACSSLFSSSGAATAIIVHACKMGVAVLYSGSWARATWQAC